MKGFEDCFLSVSFRKTRYSVDISHGLFLSVVTATHTHYRVRHVGHIFVPQGPKEMSIYSQIKRSG